MTSWHTPAHLRSLKHAIIHVDADAFFASCEQAIHPEYKGKPVVTGKERGIASAMSYEAKRRGVVRGMRLDQVRKVCPEAIIVPSDYETYSLFSKRMFSILRRYSSEVEEYGIDEAFVELTGLRQPMNMSYLQMAKKIKQEIQEELGIVVSIGLSSSKVLAKIGSKWDKPNGLTYIPGREINTFLAKTPIEKVWGIGPNTTGYMNQLGIYTALDFINRDQEYVERHFTRPHQDIWHELRGEKIYELVTEPKTSYASISKTRTFTPASSDRAFVYGQLLKNVENACIKARRHGLVGKKITVLLKKQDFSMQAVEASLTRASAYPQDLTKIIASLFDSIFDDESQYRSTGIVLSDLQENTSIQASLFEAPVQLSKLKEVYQAVDILAHKFGKHTVHLGASLNAHSFDQHAGARGHNAERKQIQLGGEWGRRRLGIPMLLGVQR